MPSMEEYQKLLFAISTESSLSSKSSFSIIIAFICAIKISTSSKFGKKLVFQKFFDFVSAFGLMISLKDQTLLSCY